MKERITEAPAPAAVALDGVARRFGGRWVLRGVTLGVQPGEAVALMGPNGSGKTTLLRIVAGVLRASRGTARVFGHDTVESRDAVRREVGLLGHSPALYPDLTARENLIFVQRMWGGVRDDAAIEAALLDVGLSAVIDERTRGFSAGMKRRLGLARLLLHPPRLLLLDEPYASFDVQGIERVNRLVVGAREAGGAVIVATHDAERARAVVDRFVELGAGRIVRDRPAYETPRLAARMEAT